MQSKAKYYTFLAVELLLWHGDSVGASQLLVQYHLLLSEVIVNLKCGRDVEEPSDKVYLL